ncbi:MAG: hypothetical protein UT02_C0006G0017 [Parcubacteria group bacterium GW2011_GWC2_38_7]|nr:MAG: hypothetical protein UT02_C0006G0017 [Parcubacteria group bacterium GW2011_GWC2_38_7]
MIQIKVLEGLRPADHAVAVARFMSKQSYGAGEVVFLKGDPGTALYIVLKGAVEVHLGDVKVDFNPGDSFGELAFLDGEARSAKITAVVDETEVATLSREQMDLIRKTNPKFAAIIYQNLGVGLAGHLRTTNSQVLALSAKELVKAPKLSALLAKIGL